MPFKPAALRYLRQLAAHNEKPWFEAHRTEYEQEVREPMRMLIEEMLMRFRAFAPEIGGDPKRSMFRINRDVRFSKDKSPYKTQAARWLKYQSFTSGRNLTDAEATGAKLESLLAREFEALLPLVRWVNGALGLGVDSRLARSKSVGVL